MIYIAPALLIVALVDAVPQVDEIQRLKNTLMASEAFKEHVDVALPVLCKGIRDISSCKSFVSEAVVCLELTKHLVKLQAMPGIESQKQHCKVIDKNIPDLSLLSKILVAPGKHRRATAFLQQMSRVQTWARTSLLTRSKQLQRSAPEDDLAQEMTHDLEMNFNKIAPFGKEDTAKELQDHAAKTQDTLVDAVENAEVAEIKRAVFRALTRLRAATIKEFDTIARLETQAIDAYNDAHHYRAENPLAHLHEDEAPVETDKLKSFH